MSKKTVVEETPIEEIVRANVMAIMEIDDPEAKAEACIAISCKFYRDGKHPQCKFCNQPEEKVLECGEAYIALMTEVDALVWSADLEKPVEREAVTAFADVKIGLTCDSCYISDNCPMFKARHKCGIDWSANIAPNKPKELLEYLIALQTERIQRAKAIEQVDGGVPDQILSTEMDRLQGLALDLQNLGSAGFRMTIEGHGDAAKPAAAGILSTLFGVKPAAEPALPASTSEPIELPVLEVIEDKKKKTVAP